MIKINLVPQDILDKERRHRQGMQFAVVSGILAVLLLLVSFFHWHKGVQLEKQLKADQVEFDRLKKLADEADEFERQAQAVRTRLNAMQDLLTGRALYPHFMEALLRTFPSGVWITNMTTSSDSAGVKANMAAKSLTSMDVAQWLRTLEKSSEFRDPVLGGPITVDPADRTSTFSMSARYNWTEVRR
jgi:Tfp pilus assembly protein PilN